MAHSIQLESFGKCVPEIKEIIGTHWQELALFKDKQPLDPQWEVYLHREARGELIFTTIRHNGRLIGYFIAFMTYGLHYRQTMTVTMDIIFVVPEFRNKGWIIKLIDFAMIEFKRRGADLVYVGSKTANSLHTGLERVYLSRGFSPADSYYARWIGD